ncbi:divisome protein SepX/GlpR [Phytoactinopolyspora mesophila]|uniref:Uncharacterized protein n=1 Tax=Phytoactinopolyspora mesophila TaxID=2650750 RepID=A0A7K3M4T4_9ACTN|nr:hypothetical protein [Phytoactinopolyspora mesophila]NDL58323.1 hypothetical protein [Phytoactinopolyspora mesophila]
MGYSGLIYAAIVAAWLAVLVPRWVRRNEEVERARETDAASGVRVLARRSGPIHAPHRTATEGANSRVIISADPGGLAPPASEPAGDGTREAVEAGSSKVPDGSSAARAEGDGRTATHARPDPSAEYKMALRRLEETFVQAAQRRRRMLAVLLAATVVSLAGTFAGPVPAWGPALVGSGLVGFLMLARGATVEQERRRTALRRKIRQRAAAAAAQPAEVAPTLTDDGKRVAVLDVPAESEPVRENTWEPVEVPLPMYMNKAKAPRVARKIDLSVPGSWTSGRLEPSRSFDLPSRPPAAAESSDRSRTEAARAEAEEQADDHSQNRRAVGE